MSTLIFSGTSESFKADRDQIRAGLRDTYNRLHSIAYDAEFVDTAVRRAYPSLPVVANQRAGAWYVKPRKDSKISSAESYAYFKSTDGHIGQPAFNLRRANLALLPLIIKNEGIVLVDSTRRGKRFPDALSKTIPIWCAVLNLARTRLSPPSPDNSSVSAAVWAEEGKLWTSPVAVGRSEHDQIDVNISRWANELVSSSYDLSALKLLDRPLRPIFVSPASDLSATTTSFSQFIPIICCSASKLAAEADGLERARGFTYVQGSGDDHEAWSKGLLPPTFWAHADEILAASREEIDDIIGAILDSATTNPIPSLTALSLDAAPSTTPLKIRGTPLSIVYASSAASTSSAALSVTITASRNPPPPTSELHSVEHLYPRTGKQGYATFFSTVEPTVQLAESALRSGKAVQVVVEAVGGGESQSEANDLGSALAVALLVRCFDDNAQLLDGAQGKVTKALIRSRLHWLLEEFPLINPCRPVLNRLNEFLMSPPRAPPSRA